MDRLTNKVDRTTLVITGLGDADLIEAIQGMCEPDEEFELSEGKAIYLPEGSRMIFNEDGHLTGVIRKKK